jgi:hypothetical protein
MPVKTDWTNGDVLTANQVSAYLANAGLDFITEVFVGDSSIASIEVDDVFGDQYSNYKVMYQGIDTSSMAVVKFQFLDGNGDPVADDYTSTATLSTFGSTTLTGETYSYWYLTHATSTPRYGAMNLYAPFIEDYSYMSAEAFSNIYSRKIAGAYTLTTSFTGFRLVGDAGTFQNGSISVFGYRQT